MHVSLILASWHILMYEGSYYRCSPSKGSSFWPTILLPQSNWPASLYSMSSRSAEYLGMSHQTAGQSLSLISSAALAQRLVWSSTSLQDDILKGMVKLSGSIRPSNNTSAPTATTSKTTGPSCFLWLSWPTTTRLVRPLVCPLSSLTRDTTQTLRFTLSRI